MLSEKPSVWCCVYLNNREQITPARTQLGTIDPKGLRPVLHNTKPTEIGEHYWRHLKLSTNWILFLDLNKLMDFCMCFYTIRMLIDKQQIDITEFHLKTCTYTFCVKMYSMEHLNNNYNAIFLYFSASYQIFCERLSILKILMNTLIVFIWGSLQTSVWGRTPCIIIYWNIYIWYV